MLYAYLFRTLNWLDKTQSLYYEASNFAEDEFDEIGNELYDILEHFQKVTGAKTFVKEVYD